MQFHKVKAQIDALGRGKVFIDDKEISKVAGITVYGSTGNLSEVQLTFYADVDLEVETESSKILQKQEEAALGQPEAIRQLREQRLVQWKPVEEENPGDKKSELYQQWVAESNYIPLSERP